MRLLKNLNFAQKDSKKLIRYVVLFVCCIIVIYQLLECFLKLRRPPISTHSRYDLNETLLMPAVTFCREPPYKPDVLKEYGLSDHPKYTIHWRQFPFNNANLTKVFEDATYDFEESFVQYALNQDQTLVEVRSSLHFYYGQCHTLRPIKPSKYYFKENGFSLMLEHTLFKYDQPILDHIPGWHVFIHEARENFTEIKMKASGRIEYIFAEVEEEIEIKLQTQQFAMMKTKNMCTSSLDYSASKCAEMNIWKSIAEKVNCTGPWMMDIELPFCRNYSTMKRIIDDYMNIYDGEVDPDLKCLDPCTSTIYSIFVQNRKSFKQPVPRTQLWIYYTSKLVSVIEERPGYDLSQFIADMGGSLGFLLGLSVIGVIEILEKILILIINSYLRKKVIIENNKTASMEKNETHHNQFEVITSTSNKN